MYTSSGNYIQILDNAEGCDSLIRLNIVISNLQAEIIKEDTILKATTGEASYQWINCITGLPVSGETSQTFIDPQPGSYAVIISDGICTDTSDCVVISATADYNSIASFDIKPNPANEGVWIVSQALGHSARMKIMDITGKSIMVNENINPNTHYLDTSLLLPGIYIIEISTDRARAAQRLTIAR